MILQALYEYYQRKAADPESHIAPEGWEWKNMPFIVAIDKQGKFIEFKDTREGEGRERRAKPFLVPSLGEGKGSGIKPDLLWGNKEYLLGIPDSSSKCERVEKQHQAFIEKTIDLQQRGAFNPALEAVVSFLRSKEPLKAKKDRLWEQVLAERTNFCIEVEGYGVITDLPVVRKAVNRTLHGEADGFCLVTGEKGKIKQLHPQVKGVRNTNPMGAWLVSVNNKIENGKNGGETPAFASYMKQQGKNAPVSESAARRYTNALNHMLNRGFPNHLWIGDSTVVFWAGKAAVAYDLESDFAGFFADAPKNDPDRGIRAVKGLFEAVYSGKLSKDEGNTFYVLGLSPNGPRIAVRFWKVGTIRDFAEKIHGHFIDLEIIKGPNDPEYLSLNQILRATALQYKMDNVPPNLAGAVVVSVLDGTPYPITLLQQCIRRIRAERHVTRARAAILKAYINRFGRFHEKSEKEVNMSLDRSNPNPGYRLGRLFAVLEAIQRYAIWPANPFGSHTTILDRFYGAASSTPVSVFSQLLKLKNHHIGKLVPGQKVNMEKEITEIMSGLSDFPPHLAMDEQARFAIGYYHQRQAFFEKKNASAKSNGNTKEERQ